MSKLSSKSTNEDNEIRRILIHVNSDDGTHHAYVLRAIGNIREHYGKQDIRLEVRVVCHGPGLDLVRIDRCTVLDELRAAADEFDGFTICACGNTLDRLTREEGARPILISQASVVPAGLPEIVELQRRGWTYLKP